MGCLLAGIKRGGAPCHDAAEVGRGLNSGTAPALVGCGSGPVPPFVGCFCLFANGVLRVFSAKSFHFGPGGDSPVRARAAAQPARSLNDLTPVQLFVDDAWWEKDGVSARTTRSTSTPATPIKRTGPGKATTSTCTGPCCPRSGSATHVVSTPARRRRRAYRLCTHQRGGSGGTSHPGHRRLPGIQGQQLFIPRQARHILSNIHRPGNRIPAQYLMINLTRHETTALHGRLVATHPLDQRAEKPSSAGRDVGQFLYDFPARSTWAT